MTTNRRPWRHDALGTSYTRETGADGIVTVRRSPDGRAVDVTIRRAAPFGTSVVDSTTSYVYMIAHVRRWQP